MSTQQDGVSESGKAMGYSVLAAALLGTLASAFLGRRKESKQEKAQRLLDEQLITLEASTDKTLAQLNQAVSGIRKHADKQSGKVSKKAAGLSRSTGRRVDDAVMSVTEMAKELERETRHIGARESALGLGSDASKRARRISKSFAQNSTDLLAEAQSAAPSWKNRAASTLTETRERSFALANTAGERAPELGKSAQKLASEAAKVGETFRDDVREHVPLARQRANLALHDVAGRGKSLVAQARESSPELREQVGGIVSDMSSKAREYAPEVEDRASEVASRVTDAAHKLASQARERGPSLIESAGEQLASVLDDAQRSARPILDDVVSQATEAGKKVQEDVIPELQHRIQDTTERVGASAQATGASIAASGHGATERLAHTSEAVEVRSKQAASAAGRGTMDLGALLGWTAAAGGLVYVTFLNDGQRERVKASGKRIASEIGNVLQDIRGQDGEFS